MRSMASGRDTGRREAVLPASVCLRWNVRSGPLALDFAAEDIAVVPLVAVQDHGCGHLVEQGVGGGAIRHRPPVGKKTRGRQKQSVSAWIFVVRPPPRERPIAWLSSPSPPKAQRSAL